MEKKDFSMRTSAAATHLFDEGARHRSTLSTCPSTAGPRQVPSLQRHDLFAAALKHTPSSQQSNRVNKSTRPPPPPRMSRYTRQPPTAIVETGDSQPETASSRTLMNSGRPPLQPRPRPERQQSLRNYADDLSSYYHDQTQSVHQFHSESGFSQGRVGFPPAPTNSSVLSTQRRSWQGGGTLVSEQLYHPDEKLILNEYVIERDIRVPMKLTSEDIVERTYVVPEKILVEEMVEETTRIVEKIVEIAKPIVREKIVEVPEVQVIERIVEVPTIVKREKTREVPRIEFVERIIEVPRVVMQEKIVEVPMVEYRDVPVEVVVEVPEVREQIVWKEKQVPQYVNRPVMETRDIEVVEERKRILPVPVEVTTTVEFKVPKLRPVYTATNVPVYVPRFVEVAVPAEFCEESLLDSADRCYMAVSKVMEQTATERVTLTELDNTAAMVQGAEFSQAFEAQNYLENFANWWFSNQLNVDECSLRSVCKTVDKDGTAVTEAVSLIRSVKKEEVEANSWNSEHVSCVPLLSESLEENNRPSRDSSVHSHSTHILDEGVNELSVIQRMSSRSNDNSVATFDGENEEDEEVCQLQSVVTVQEERRSSCASLS